MDGPGKVANDARDQINREKMDIVRDRTQPTCTTKYETYIGYSL